MQALVARELVEGFGLPERRAAALLGIVPSSVSQYLSGKRLGQPLAAHVRDPASRRLARQTAQALIQGAPASRTVLAAAAELGDPVSLGRARSIPVSRASGRLDSRAVPRWLRARIAGEQTAVAECMRLAQRSRDELTRALFRQIASDSLRHAEIVASIGAYLDRGVSSSPPTGITRADVEALIRREHEAEATAEADLGPDLGGVMKILWESMEADERKHELLLDRLLGSDLEEERRRSSGRRTAVRARAVPPSASRRHGSPGRKVPPRG
jgi:uncharacterized protein